MKTTEDFIKEMESSNVLMSSKHTFKEYASELLLFQDMICKMIAGDAYHDKMRVDEALFIMESTARKKNLRSNPVVHNGVLTMKKLVKEMAITISGVKGEKQISRILKSLKRPNTQIFQNVYVTDGKAETELDDIVLTDEGILILEVKKVKSDLVLTKEGRMVFEGDECFDKMPLANKMALKRKLLKKSLKNALAEKHLDIPVFVDSYIVFSTSGESYIHIDDRCHREKYCFSSTLNKTIENYFGCAYYKEEQLQQLGGILSEMESNVKRFEKELDYDEVRRSLAEALFVLQDDTADTEIHEVPTSKQAKANKPKIEREKSKHKDRELGYAVACACIGLVLSGVALLMGGNPRRT